MNLIMIYIKVRNGLGNQLFCYALGIYIENFFPDLEIRYDLSELPLSIEGRKTYDVEKIFLHSFRKADSCEIREYCGKPFFTRRTYGKNKNIFLKIISKLNMINTSKKVDVEFIEPDYWNDNSVYIREVLQYPLENNKTYYYDGSWEDTQILIPIRDLLIEKFTFRKFDNLKKIEDEIMSTNSVAIHIRRGDYISESLKQPPTTIFDLCDNSYYNKAIEIINKMVENPIFYIFTDDVKYAEKMYNFSNFKIVQGNKDYEDMYLMSLCKYNIICNSTFSFWGAFLSTQKKAVIAPKTHLIRRNIENDIEKEYFSIPEWIYIDNRK